MRATGGQIIEVRWKVIEQSITSIAFQFMPCAQSQGLFAISRG